MIKKAALIALFAVIFSHLNAQNLNTDSLPGNDYREKTEYLFARLNRQKMQSNVLVDKGVEVVSFNDYNGTNSADTCTPLQMSFLWQSLYYGRNGKSPFPILSPDSMAMALDTLYNSQLYPISLLFADYDRIIDALPPGTDIQNNGELFRMDVNQIVDGSSSINPYKTSTIFAAVSHLSDVDGDATFILPEEAFVSNKNTAQNASIEIDFKDGEGYQALIPGQAIDIKFPTAGIKTCQVRLVHQNTTYQAKFSINVKNASKDVFFKDNIRDQIWQDPNLLSASEAYIYLRNSNNGRLRKPVIFIEGFDPNNEFKEVELYDLLNNNNPNPNGLLEELNTAGHDVIILNLVTSKAILNQLLFPNGPDIGFHAETLRRLIKWVNQNKQGNEPLVIAGASMGGLVARMALAKMEKEYCEEHYTRLYISYDSPHQGANAPVSLQHVLNGLNNLTLGLSGDIRMGTKMLNSAAGKELLLHHISSNDGPTEEHFEFYNELNRLGYPQQTRNIAVTLGSTFTNMPESDISSSTYGPSDTIFTWSKNKNRGSSLFIDSYAKAISPNADGNKKIAKNRFLHRTIIKFNFFGDVRWTIDVTLQDKEYDYNSGGNEDYEVGGNIRTQAIVSDGINEQKGFGEAITPDNRKHHAIVPTNSSLDILLPNAPTRLLMLEDEIVANGFTPFEKVYARNINVNSDHVGNVVKEASTSTNFVDEIFNEITNPINSTIVLPNVLNEKYNATVLTGNAIKDLVIAANGKFYVNANLSAGLGTSAPIPEESSVLNLSTNISGQNTCSSNITVEKDGFIILGDASTGNVGNLNFTNNSTLNLKSGSNVLINNNSTLRINSGANINIEPGTNIILEGNAELIIDGALALPNRSSGNALVNVSGSGKLIVRGGNQVTLNNQNGLSVSNSASVIFNANTSIDYGVGSTLKITGTQANIEFQGPVHVAENATFTYGSDNDSQGYIVFNSSDPLTALTAGNGSRIVLPQRGSNNKVLEIRQSVALDIFTDDQTYFDAFVADGARIDIASNAYLQIAMPSISFNEAYISGGNLRLYRRNLLVNAAIFSQSINNTVFQSCTITDLPGFDSFMTEPLMFENCRFITNSLLMPSSGQGIVVNNCDFSSGSRIISTRGNVQINNSNFTGPSNSNAGIALSNAFAPTSIRNTRISGYFNGLSNSNNSNVILECNRIEGNQSGMVHGSLSEAIVTGQGAGNNFIVNNEFTNIRFLNGNTIDFANGGNAFYNSLSQNGNPNRGLIFSGDAVGICTTVNDMPLGIASDATGNQWHETVFSTRPQDVPERFGQTRIITPITCSFCDTEYQDNAPRQAQQCLDGSNPDPSPDPIPDPIPVLRGILGGLGGNSSSNSNQEICLTCPLISTSDFVATTLVAAVNEAAALTTILGGNDDARALELFRQILTFPFPVKTNELYHYLNRSYIYAKSAAVNSLPNSGANYVESRMNAIFNNFNPSDFPQVDAINDATKMLDKAYFQRIMGQFNDALNTLTEIELMDAEFIQPMVDEQKLLLQLDEALFTGTMTTTEFADTVAGLIGRDIIDIILDCGEGGSPVGGNLNQSFGNPTESLSSQLSSDKTLNDGVNSKLAVLRALPNPSNGMVAFSYDKGINKIHVFSSTGKLLFDKTVDDKQSNIDLSDYDNGVYIVHILDKQNQWHQRRIIKQ